MSKRQQMAAMPEQLRRRLGRFLGARTPALQVAALCVEPATGRVLMITSRGTGRWIIPKGWPMPGRTLVEAALQEAWEEAGVNAVPGPDLGVYHYEKLQDHGFAIPVEVRVFLAEVTGLANAFPEAGKRRRLWFSPAEAAALVAEPELAALILGLSDRAPPTARAADDAAQGSGDETIGPGAGATGSGDDSRVDSAGADGARADAAGTAQPRAVRGRA